MGRNRRGGNGRIEGRKEKQVHNKTGKKDRKEETGRRLIKVRKK